MLIAETRSSQGPSRRESFAVSKFVAFESDLASQSKIDTGRRSAKIEGVSSKEASQFLVKFIDYELWILIEETLNRESAKDRGNQIEKFVASKFISISNRISWILESEKRLLRK